MKIAFKTIASIAAVASVSACLDVSDIDTGGGNTNGSSPFNQTIGFARGDGGGGTVAQTVQSGAGTPGKARVCFVNNGPVQAALTHGIPGINPLSAAPGGQSCANFQSSARVAFTLVEISGSFPRPATPDRAFAYSLSPFEGDVMQLVWRVN